MDGISGPLQCSITVTVTIEPAAAVLICNFLYHSQFMLDQKPKIVDLWKHLDNVSPAGPVHKYPGIVHLGINFDLSSLTNHLIDIGFYNSDGETVWSLIQFEIWEHHIGSSHLHRQLRNCVQFKRWLLVTWTSQNSEYFLMLTILTITIIWMTMRFSNQLMRSFPWEMCQLLWSSVCVKQCIAEMFAMNFPVISHVVTGHWTWHILRCI